MRNTQSVADAASFRQPMRRYVLATLILCGSAVVIAVGGVNTAVFACGNGACSQPSPAKDETPPVRPFCNIGIDCPVL
jgi:hypothetical protein